MRFASFSCVAPVIPLPFDPLSTLGKFSVGDFEEFCYCRWVICVLHLCMPHHKVMSTYYTYASNCSNLIRIILWGWGSKRYYTHTSNEPCSEYPVTTLDCPESLSLSLWNSCSKRHWIIKKDERSFNFAYQVFGHITWDIYKVSISLRRLWVQSGDVDTSLGTYI